MGDRRPTSQWPDRDEHQPEWSYEYEHHRSPPLDPVHPPHSSYYPFPPMYQHAYDAEMPPVDTSVHARSIVPAIESAMWQRHPPQHFQAPAQPFVASAVDPRSPSFAYSVPPWESSSSSPTTVGDLVGNLPVPYDEQGAQPHASTSSAQVSSVNTSAIPKPFVSILHSILANSAAYGDCLVWDDLGTSFIVSHNEKLIKEVLPRHFQHSNLQSFTRQLNVYEFTRIPTPQLLEMLDLSSTKSHTNFSGWSHPCFRRDDKSLLATMKPRPSKARQLKKAEKEATKVAQLQAQRERQYYEQQHQHHLQQQQQYHLQQRPPDGYSEYGPPR